MVNLKKILTEFQCDDCGLVCSDFKQFLWHRKHHANLLRSGIAEETLLRGSCPICFVKYWKKYRGLCLEEHLGSSGAVEKFEKEAKTAKLRRCRYCLKCDVEFVSVAEFVKHSKEIHNDNKPFACHQCDYTGTQYQNFKRHLLTHLKYRRFKCHLCAKKYTSREGLRDHLLTIHNEIFSMLSKKRRGPRLEGHPDSGKPLKESRKESKSGRVMRCKYFPKCNAEFKTDFETIKHSKEVHNDNRPYTCEQCNYAGTRYRNLKQHLLIHMGYKRYKCDLCPKEYVTREGFHYHLLAAHSEVPVKSHDCPHCGKKFFNPCRLKRHFTRHFPSPEMFKCHLCDKEYTCEYDLKNHIKTHQKLFKCDICLKKFAQKASLEKHLRNHQKGKVKSYCTLCGQNYSNDEDLKKHLKVHFPTPATTSCHICSKELSSRNSLISHFRTHFKMFKCHLCPKEYARKESLDTHFLSNHNEVKIKSLDCFYCDKKCPTPHKLRLHLRRHATTETFKCHICSKELSSKYNLKSHIKRHNALNRKTYDCTECGQSFVCESSIKKHLDPSKESTNTLCCRRCPKSFKNLNCFTYHKRTHRELVCEVCKLKCYSIIQFKAHSETHGISSDTSTCTTQEQNSSSKEIFKCSMCPKEFSSNSKLKEHLRKHEGKEAYVCKSCGKKFVSRKLLKAHHNPEKETKNPQCCKQCPKTFHNTNCLRYHRLSHMEEFLCDVCSIKCFSRGGFKAHLARHGINWNPTI